MRPVPQSVWDRAELLYRSHNLKTVSEILGKPECHLRKIRQRGWVANAYPLRPRPTDFAIQANHMSARQLQRHYNAGQRVVARWLKELRG